LQPNVELTFARRLTLPAPLSRFDARSGDPSVALVVVAAHGSSRRSHVDDTRWPPRARQTVGSRVATMIGLPRFGPKFVADTGEVAVV
jgi:hypothetical protein